MMQNIRSLISASRLLENIKKLMFCIDPVQRGVQDKGDNYKLSFSFHLRTKSLEYT